MSNHDDKPSTTKPLSTKGRLRGQKAPLKLSHGWAVRIRLRLAEHWRDLALFNRAIDSKLRGCDLVKLRILDVVQAGRVLSRVNVVQQKTGRPVQFEITELTRESLNRWIGHAGLTSSDYLFPSREKASPHLSTQQYRHRLRVWIESIGLDPSAYGTHSLRRTKVTLIYRQTKNLRSGRRGRRRLDPCRTGRSVAQSQQLGTAGGRSQPVLMIW